MKRYGRVVFLSKKHGIPYSTMKKIVYEITRRHG